MIFGQESAYEVVGVSFIDKGGVFIFDQFGDPCKAMLRPRSVTRGEAHCNVFDISYLPFVSGTR
jgi:hypothetical protein